MPPADAAAADNFAMVCLKCDQRIVARRAWVGLEVQCPHCAATMRVPPPRADGQPVRAIPPLLVTRPHRFNFSCPRCESLLESQRLMSGQSGSCPTCGARFLIPQVDPATGDPLDAELIDADTQDPTPLHAYAASGHQAPRIEREPDGTLHIICPRCGRRSDVTANNCAACGVPFSIEGVPTAPAAAVGALDTAALVLGILGLPLCMLFVPSGVALLLAAISWFQRPGRRFPRRTIVALILGTAGLGLGVLYHLL